MIGNLHFREPQWIWVSIFAILLLVLLRWWKRGPAVTISALSRASALPSSSPLRLLPCAAMAAALTALGLALADPVIERAAMDGHAEALDLMMVVDLSSSMQEVMGLPAPASGSPFSASDNTPRRIEGRTRLEVTKEALTDFVGQRAGDRLGLVVFSDRAYLISPLTFDHDNLTGYVGMIDDQILRGEGMTAIGEGIALASQVLARQSTRSERNKVIVVFTDGENNTGRAPIDALAEADRAGYRLHMIGVDLEDEVKAKPSVVQLVSAVRARGGGYFVADTADQLRAAYRAIDRAERGWIAVTSSSTMSACYDDSAAVALILLVSAMVTRALAFARVAS